MTSNSNKELIKMLDAIKKSLTICLLTSAFTSQASENTNPSNQTKSLIIGVENTAFYPHYTTSKAGEYTGYARDLFDKFQQHSGIQIEYRPMPVDQLFDALVSGEVDMKYPDNANWASHLKEGLDVTYSQQVTRYVDGVLRKPQDRGQPLLDIEQLATVTGWTVWDYLDQVNSGQITVSENKNLRQMVRKVIRNKADGAYFNIVVATHYLENVRLSPLTLVFDPSLPHTQSTYHLSTIKHPEVLTQFNQFLEDQSEQVDDLKDLYAVEKNLNNGYLGMETWKEEWLARKRIRRPNNDSQRIDTVSIAQ